MRGDVGPEASRFVALRRAAGPERDASAMEEEISEVVRFEIGVKHGCEPPEPLESPKFFGGRYTSDQVQSHSHEPRVRICLRIVRRHQEFRTLQQGFDQTGPPRPRGLKRRYHESRCRGTGL